MNKKSTSPIDQADGPDPSCLEPTSSADKLNLQHVLWGVHIWHLSLVCLGIVFIASPWFIDGGIIGWFTGADYEPMPKNLIGFVFGLLQIAEAIFLGLLNCLIGLGFILTAAVGSISAGMGTLFVRRPAETTP